MPMTSWVNDYIYDVIETVRTLTSLLQLLAHFEDLPVWESACYRRTTFSLGIRALYKLAVLGGCGRWPGDDAIRKWQWQSLVPYLPRSYPPVNWQSEVEVKKRGEWLYTGVCIHLIMSIKLSTVEYSLTARLSPSLASQTFHSSKGEEKSGKLPIVFWFTAFGFFASCKRSANFMLSCSISVYV